MRGRGRGRGGGFERVTVGVMGNGNWVFGDDK